MVRAEQTVNISNSSGIPLGAHYQGDQQCSFLVWGPRPESVDVHIVTPTERLIPLRKNDAGYFEGSAEGIEPGARYFLRLNGKHERPDPASRFQPEGVHGPSEILDPAFDWEDQAWFGCPLRDYIIYELHIGTFTSEGTFAAAIPHLRSLKELGITALQLMPVAQFPGCRNWGYDGVYPFAVQASYGGPNGLKTFVNAAHQEGLAVILDVVYNHLGPEGNYLREFGNYFTDSYRTPWGAPLNFDAEFSHEVRRFFLENASYWIRDFRIDCLRLDAVHAIKDFSAFTFLQQLAEEVQRLSQKVNRRAYLVAESDSNDPRLISSPLLGGYGLDAQWSDDFHHCLHVLLTGEQEGYYADFGGVSQFCKVWSQGYAYTGQYSRFRKRPHGSPPRAHHARQFVVYSQNHDQIGNRMQGERLSRLTDHEGLKLAAATVFLSPFIPLIFMGEEYGETAPFNYVISHTDPQLIEAVRQGRRQEFAGFAWAGDVPDPQAESTFRQCVLNRCLPEEPNTHAALYKFYRELIRIRKEVPAFAEADFETIRAEAPAPGQVLHVRYAHPSGEACAFFNFAIEPQAVNVPARSGKWKKILDSCAREWAGPGARGPERLMPGDRSSIEAQPKSVLVYCQS